MALKHVAGGLPAPCPFSLVVSRVDILDRDSHPRHVVSLGALPHADVEYLDEYAREQRLGSRSAALRRAVRLLRAAELGAEYESAWDEWESSDDAEAWNGTTGDGLNR